MHMCVAHTKLQHAHPTAEMKAVPHFHYSTTLTRQLQQYVLHLYFKLLLCTPTALSLTYNKNKKKNLNSIDKNNVLRCKDWWPHWSNKTNWFILACCRSQAREKVYKKPNVDVARQLTLRVAERTAHLSIWMKSDRFIGLQTQGIGCYVNCFFMHSSRFFISWRRTGEFGNFLKCMKSYLSDFEMKDGWRNEDYIQCCTVKVKLGQEMWK